jgi:hypothetical protein
MMDPFAYLKFYPKTVTIVWLAIKNSKEENITCKGR